MKQAVAVLAAAPAALNGSLSGFATSARTGVPLFSVDFTANGTASSTFRERPLATGRTDFVPAGSSTFTVNAVSPTPEPASVLLVGGGLAAIFARRRRRAHKTVS